MPAVATFVSVPIMVRGLGPDAYGLMALMVEAAPHDENERATSICSRHARLHAKPVGRGIAPPGLD